MAAATAAAATAPAAAPPPATGAPPLPPPPPRGAGRRGSSSNTASRRVNERTAVANALRADLLTTPPPYLTVAPVLPALSAKVLYAARALVTMGVCSAFMLHPDTRTLLKGAILAPVAAVVTVQHTLGGTVNTALRIVAAAVWQQVYCAIVAAVLPRTIYAHVAAVTVGIAVISFLEVAQATKRFFSGALVVSLLSPAGDASFATVDLLSRDVGFSMLLGSGLGVVVTCIPAPTFTTTGREVGVRLRRAARGLGTQFEALALAFSHRSAPTTVMALPASLHDMGVDVTDVVEAAAVEGEGDAVTALGDATPLPMLARRSSAEGVAADGVAAPGSDGEGGGGSSDGDDGSEGGGGGGSSVESVGGHSSSAGRPTGRRRRQRVVLTRDSEAVLSADGAAAADVVVDVAGETSAWAHQGVTHGSVGRGGGGGGAGVASPGGGGGGGGGEGGGSVHHQPSLFGLSGVPSVVGDGTLGDGPDDDGTAPLLLLNVGTGERAPLLRADIQDMHWRTGEDLPRMAEAAQQMAFEPMNAAAAAWRGLFACGRWCNRGCRAVRTTCCAAACCRSSRCSRCCCRAACCARCRPDAAPPYAARLREWVSVTDKLQRIARSAMTAEAATRTCPTHAAMLDYVEQPVCALVRTSTHLHRVALAYSGRLLPGSAASPACVRALPGLGIAGEERPTAEAVLEARAAVAAATTEFFKAYGRARAAVVYHVESQVAAAAAVGTAAATVPSGAAGGPARPRTATAATLLPADSDSVAEGSSTGLAAILRQTSIMTASAFTRGGSFRSTAATLPVVDTLPTVHWHALDMFAINAFMFFCLRFAQSVRAAADTITGVVTLAPHLPSLGGAVPDVTAASTAATSPISAPAPETLGAFLAATWRWCVRVSRRAVHYAGCTPSRRAAARALRVSLSVLVATIVSIALEPVLGSKGYAFWAPVSCAFLSGGSDGATFKSSILRTIGTLVGATFAYVSVRLVGTSAVTMGVLASLWVAIMQFPRTNPVYGNWALISAFTAAIIMIVTSTASTTLSTDEIALIRIEQTILGITVYIVVHLVVLPVRARHVVAERTLGALTALANVEAALVTEFSRFMRQATSQLRTGTGGSTGGSTPIAGSAPGTPTPASPTLAASPLAATLAVEPLKDPTEPLAASDRYLTALPELLSDAVQEPDLTGVPFESLRRHYIDLGDATKRIIFALRVINQCLIALHGQASVATAAATVPAPAAAPTPVPALATAPGGKPPRGGVAVHFNTPLGATEHVFETDQPSSRGLLFLEPMWQLITTIHTQVQAVLGDTVALMAQPPTNTRPQRATVAEDELPDGTAAAAGGGGSAGGGWQPGRRERAPSSGADAVRAADSPAAVILLRLPLLVDDMLAATQVFIASYNAFVHSLTLEAAAERETDSVAAAAAAAAAGAGGAAGVGRLRRLPQLPMSARLEVAARMPLTNLDALCFNTLSFAVIQLVEAVADAARLSRRLYHSRSAPTGWW